MPVSNRTKLLLSQTLFPERYKERQLEHKQCIACDGTGKNSKGGDCVVCTETSEHRRLQTRIN